MLTFLKNLSIKTKFFWFIAPSITAFGIMLTGPTLFSPQDFKMQSRECFEQALTVQQLSSADASRNTKSVRVVLNTSGGEGMVETSAETSRQFKT